jgi:hypothetical protein
LAVWLVLLTLLGTLLYLNQVGLPGFVKKPLLEKVRARGIDLQFSRLRLSWYEGVVAEDVRFGRAEDSLSPQLTLREVQVRLNLRALSRLRLQVDSLLLRHGRLVLPVVETNAALRQLTVENIQTDLRFLPDDQWALDHFKARFAGANFQLSGSFTNASAVREWGFFQAKPAAPARVWQNQLRQLADTLDRIHFPRSPELWLDVRGDARDLRSFTARLSLNAPGADTPWGTFQQGQLTARLFSATTNGLSEAEISLEAAGAQTRWASTTNLHLTLHLASSEAQTNLVNVRLALLAGHVRTEWASASDARFTAQWVHSLTNPIPLSGQGQLRCDRAQTRWGRAKEVQLAARLGRPSASEPVPMAQAAWGFWTNLQPYLLDWQCRVQGLDSPKFQADDIVAGGGWRAPELAITNLQVKLYQAQVEAHADLDVASRALNLSLVSDLDPHTIAPLLGQAAQRWLGQFTWDAAPRLNADVSVVLPAWTNRGSFESWLPDIQPALRLQGEFALDHGATYRQVPVSTAHSHFIYSNMCWTLPDLAVTRPEGHLEAKHHADDRTKDFYWRISSTVDVGILRSLLDPAQQRGFDLVSLTQPPVIEAEVWGRFHDPDRVGFKGRIALTNFTFRGQSAAGLETGLQYTNRLLQFFAPRIHVVNTQYLSADGLTADFNSQRLFLTNGVGVTDPMLVPRAIGPHIVRAVEPYHFTQPIRAHVYGIIPLHGEEDADLHFDIEGGPFYWWRVRTPHLAGHVHWRGEQVTLTNVQTDFYSGKAAGWAVFDFKPHQGTDFQFALSATNALLQALMADLSSRTNHLEGWLTGSLNITKANTTDWRTVFGYGDLELRDGLIWDLPLFGIFSPVLNGLAPGLGNSRATAADCTYFITNGVFHSDDLEIRCSGMRLEYRGTVDFNEKVNAKVEAELLRDMWVVGPVVSTVFWPFTKMFEYRLTGKLSDPKAEPVFLLPKLVLLPFRPLRTLKGLLPEDSDPSRTNAPPPAK